MSYLYKTIQTEKGEYAIVAFKKLLETESQNPDSPFLKYKRYQILDPKELSKEVEEEHVIDIDFNRYSLRKNQCGCYLLSNNRFQFIIPA